MLTLKSLKIERCDWSHMPQFGRHEGKAVFDGEGGSVEIKLTPELCHRLFLLCADAVVDVAKQAATALVCEAQATIAKDATPAIGGR